MKIESVTKLPQSGRFALVFDDGHKMRVEPSVVADLGLCSGRSLTEEEYQTLQETARRASARARAVRIVAASGVSEQELRRRLVQKGEEKQDAEDAVAWLSDLGVMDDEKTARDIARRAAAKGYGKARIRQELYQKGIPREYWDEALAALPEPDDAIDRFLAQRLHGQMPDQKELKKVTDALCRRGHSWADIKAALARYGAAQDD
jgi:regulatory protein